MNKIFESFPFTSNFVSYLLKEEKITLMQLRGRLSAELKAAGALLENEQDDGFLDTREIQMKFNIRNFKKIHSRSMKLTLLWFSRLLILSTQDENFSFLFREIVSLFNQKDPSLRRTAKFSNFTELPDEIFLAETEKLLEQKEERLRLIRILRSTRKKGEPTYSSIVFQELLSIKFEFLNRPKPKPLVRHKGYRDHGSLRQSKLTRPDQSVKISSYEEDREHEIESERNAILEFYSDIEFSP